jgi:simple sugar transport system permease protein
MTVETPPRTEGAEPSAERLVEGPTRGRAVVRILVSATLLAACIMVALGLASLLLAITGQSPGDVLDAMIEGSVSSTPAIVSSLNHAALVLTVAIGACIAFRAGLVNIGLEGQLTIGGLAGAAVGLALPFDGVLAILIILASAALGGALWVLLPAFLKYGRGVSEVVTTLLLNFVAFQLVSFMVNRSYLLQENVEDRFNLAPQPQSDRLPEGDRLPAVVEGLGYRLHVGIAVAVVLALVVAFLIVRSRWGLQLRTFGFNPRVAERVGVRPAVTGGGALLLAGAFAGLAGGFLLTGVVLRIQGGFSSGVYGGFSNNYGWEGLLAALVARYRPLYAIAVAVFFGGLRAGGGFLAATGVSVTIVGVVQALVVLAVTVPAVLLQGREQARQRELAQERT